MSKVLTVSAWCWISKQREFPDQGPGYLFHLCLIHMGALWFPVGIGLLLYFTKCEKYGLFWPFSTAPIIVLCYIQGTWSFACLCFKLLFFLHLKCYCTRCDLFFFFFWIKAICPECWLVDDGTHLCPQPDELRVLEYNQSSGQIGLTSPLKLAHSTSHSVSFTV